VKEECEKFGRVLEIKVPRPTGGSRQSNGVGKIFVKFDTPESAGKALRALAGRKFADRTVVTTYFSEVRSPELQRLGMFTDLLNRKISKSLLGKVAIFPYIPDAMIQRLDYALADFGPDHLFRKKIRRCNSSHLPK
jgi:hypothetical protein